MKAKLLANNLFHPMQIRTQDFRDEDTAISLLKIFQNGHKQASDRQAGAVQGMYELWFGLFLPLEPDLGPSRLVISEVAAGTNFSESTLARQPNL